MRRGTLDFVDTSVIPLCCCLFTSHRSSKLIHRVHSPFTAYASWSYYGKWAASMTRILLENGHITQTEIDAELGPTTSDSAILFKAGDRVTVKHEGTKSRWRKPHLRVPGYIFGCTGVVERVAGLFPNPEVGSRWKRACELESASEG